MLQIPNRQVEVLHVTRPFPLASGEVNGPATRDYAVSNGEQVMRDYALLNAFI